jgi:arsenate reductase (glutaredoxin)
MFFTKVTKVFSQPYSDWGYKIYNRSMLKIYHNPLCKKSRAGLKYLQDQGIPFEITEYMKKHLTEKDLEKLLVKLNLKPVDIIRSQEDYFKKNLKGKKFNDHEWIRIILQNPKLLKRPIIETDYKAVIGDPLSNIDLILKPHT